MSDRDCSEQLIPTSARIRSALFPAAIAGAAGVMSVFLAWQLGTMMKPVRTGELILIPTWQGVVAVCISLILANSVLVASGLVVRTRVRRGSGRRCFSLLLSSLVLVTPLVVLSGVPRGEEVAVNLRRYEISPELLSDAGDENSELFGLEHCRWFQSSRGGYGTVVDAIALPIPSGMLHRRLRIVTETGGRAAAPLLGPPTTGQRIAVIVTGDGIVGVKFRSSWILVWDSVAETTLWGANGSSVSLLQILDGPEIDARDIEQLVAMAKWLRADPHLRGTETSRSAATEDDLIAGLSDPRSAVLSACEQIILAGGEELYPRATKALR